jgi:hypothetical protein
LSRRTYLAPAFDVVAAGQVALPEVPCFLVLSGGRELGFDDSPFRFRRACFSAAADLDNRRQARLVHAMQDHDALQVEVHL